MRLVLCVSWRPQGCVFPAEEVLAAWDLAPGGRYAVVTQLDTPHAVLLRPVFWRRTRSVKMDQAGAAALCAHNRSQRAPSEVLAAPLSRTASSVAAPRTQHLQIACWAGRNARTARTAALGAGSRQQGYASRPNLGLPAGAPVPPGGSGTQAQIGAAGAAEDDAEGRIGATQLRSKSEDVRLPLEEDRHPQRRQIT